METHSSAVRNTWKMSGLFLLLLLATSACRKDHPTCNCYDEELFQQRKDSYCTTDCPGVTGCDGKFYCNECEANRKGIRVK